MGRAPDLSHIRYVAVSALFNVLNSLLTVYFIILVLRSLVSWTRPDPNSDLVRFLYAITEPVLEPIRAILPQTGMIDFSPLVATVLIIALQQVLSILASGH